jgi:hypothetical protein
VLASHFTGRYGLADGLLGSFQIAEGDDLSGRHGSQRHGSDADQAQVVQPPECWRGVDMRAFDRDDSGLFEDRDCRIDVSGRPIL